jgi:hypothetical protein
MRAFLALPRQKGGLHGRAAPGAPGADKLCRSNGVGMERSGMTYANRSPSRLLAAKRKQACYAKWGGVLHYSKYFILTIFLQIFLHFLYLHHLICFYSYRQNILKNYLYISFTRKFIKTAPHGKHGLLDRNFLSFVRDVVLCPSSTPSPFSP